MLNPEQVAVTQKTHLDILFGLTEKLLEGVEKLTELNFQMIRSTLAESQERALKTVSAKEPQEWLALQTGLGAPMVEKAQTYGRQLFEIVSTTQAEFARLAYAQFQAYGYQGETVVQEAART